jgi:hypothetical protein
VVEGDLFFLFYAAKVITWRKYLRPPPLAHFQCSSVPIKTQASPHLGEVTTKLRVGEVSVTIYEIDHGPDDVTAVTMGTVHRGLIPRDPSFRSLAKVRVCSLWV